MKRFIITADTGSGKVYQIKVANSMVQLQDLYDNIQSVLLLGDNIYPAGCRDVSDEQFKTKFEDPYQNQLLEDPSSKIVYDLKVKTLKTKEGDTIINEVLNRGFREL